MKKKGGNIKGDRITRQDLFIKYYFDPESPTYLDCTKSGIKAGYSPKSATHLLNETNRNHYTKIRKKLLEFNKSYKVDEDYVINNLKKFTEFSPSQLKKYRGSLSDKIRSVELIGKTMKMFVDRKEVDFPAGVEIRIVEDRDERKKGDRNISAG